MALPLVLIHGFPLDSTMWRRQKRSLQRLGFTVLTPDLPGFGGRPPLPPAANSISAFADDIAESVRHSCRRAVVAGFSMGGYVLLALLENHPDLVAGAVFIDTHSAADAQPVRQNRLAMAETVAETGMEPVSQAMLPRLLSPTAGAGVLSAVRRMILAQSPAGIAMAQRAMASRPDRSDLLASIGCPALVMAGDEDMVTPPAIAHAMAARIADCRCSIIPRSGHLSPMQAPRRVSRELAEFVTQIA